MYDFERIFDVPNYQEKVGRNPHRLQHRHGHVVSHHAVCFETYCLFVELSEKSVFSGALRAL